MSTKKHVKERGSEDLILKKMRLASEMTPEQMKEYFPALHAELTGKRKGLVVSSQEIKQALAEQDEKDRSTSVTTGSRDEHLVEVQGMRIPDPLEGFDPGVIDFIRRAKTEAEAIEVIEYMKNRGEITEDEARNLHERLKTQGLRSFGSFKQDGYYFHYAQEERMRYRQKLIEQRKKRKKGPNSPLS